VLALALCLAVAMSGCADPTQSADGQPQPAPPMVQTSGGASFTATPSTTAKPHPPTPTADVPIAGTTRNGCAITQGQAAAEQQLVTLLNAHRATASARSLRLDAALSGVSREHSCDMELQSKLGHTGGDGSSPFQRIAAAGITYTSAGENVGTATGYGLSGGVSTIDGAMFAEPLAQGNHHWNIVNAGYILVGIGIIYTNGRVWLTEDFVG
jgi:uncharacterized protein YkwD